MNTFWRNKVKTKINPATETSLAALKAKTDLLTFDDAGAPANLTINIGAGIAGIFNKLFARVNPATQGTLAAMKVQTDKLTFASDRGLKASGTAPALASSVSVKDISLETLSESTREDVQLWQRMVKILESHAVVDANNNQRVSVDFFGAVTGTGLSGDGVPLVTMASDLVRTIPGISTPTIFVGAGNQVFQDYARNAYARSIRRNLHFT